MNFEQKYKEALERAKSKIKNDKDHVLYESDVIDIFPELYESEDERIKNEIIDYISTADDKELIPYESWIAWLEKQGEQIDIANKEYWRGYREGKKEILDKYAELEKQSKQSSNILWHDVSEEPDEQREIFCEWKWNDGVWHDVVFYHADTKNFWDGEQKIEGVVKWTYVNEMLGKQVEQKSITSTSVPFETSDYSELIGKTITIPDGCSAHIKDNNVYINKQDKSEIKPKFRVKYAGSEYNVLEIKEIGGITFYGIDDEPNHIDFIQAANCEII